MARSAAQAVCLSCERMITIGAHSRDCEFCGARIARCPECWSPISFADAKRCLSCNATISNADLPITRDNARRDSPVRELLFSGASRGSWRKSLSGWGFVAALILVAAAAFVVYGLSSNWQGFGEESQVGGTRHAACLAAEGYSRELATPDQAAINRQALSACQDLD